MVNIPEIIFYSLGLSLSFSLYLIYKKCNKNKNNIQSKQNNSFLVLVPKQIKNISKFKKFLWILFISLIDFISYLLKTLIIRNIFNDISSWAINFIFMSLYFYFIFKIKLYKHHILCIIGFGLMGIIFIIMAFIVWAQDNDFTLKIYLIRYALNFLSVTLYCLAVVIYKFFTKETYLKSYEILYIQGLIELLLSSILVAILIHCKVICNLDYYIKYIKKSFVNCILSVFFKFGYYSHLYIIIDIFSPFHIFLTVFIYYIIYIFISFDCSLIEPISETRVLCIFLGSISLFLIFIFIEIIELNCFGLSYMTKKISN